MSKCKLPYTVECKSTYPFFEAIAAFNVGPIAIAYAKECREGKPSSFEYRVMYRGKPFSAERTGEAVEDGSPPILFMLIRFTHTSGETHNI